MAAGWKANGASRTTFTESGNNPGGGRQVNTTAGLSIIDYTGTGGNGTIAHGLGVTPNWVIVRNRDGGNNDANFHHFTGLLSADDRIFYNGEHVGWRHKDQSDLLESRDYYFCIKGINNNLIGEDSDY